MCWKCDWWNEVATREPTPQMRAAWAATGRGPDPVTRMTCPICDANIMAPVRDADLVKAVGRAHWAEARARYRAEQGLPVEGRGDRTPRELRKNAPES